MNSSRNNMQKTQKEVREQINKLQSQVKMLEANLYT